METATNEALKQAPPATLEGYAEALKTTRTSSEPGLVSVTKVEAAFIATAKPRRRRHQVLPGVKNTARAIREHIQKLIEADEEFDSVSFANRMLAYMKVSVGLPTLDVEEMERFRNSVSSELSKLTAAGVTKVVKRNSTEGGGFWNSYVLVIKDFNARHGVSELIEKAGERIAAEEGPREVPAGIASEGPLVERVASKAMMSDRVEAILRIADTFEKLGPKIMELSREVLAEVHIENQKANLHLATEAELLAEVSLRMARASVTH